MKCTAVAFQSFCFLIVSELYQYAEYLASMNK